jgi:type IV fimbrial biogenesis protein FimT
VAARGAGFTLVELLVVLTIVSALLTLAVPAVSDLIKNNRLLSESYALRAALSQARSEALSQRSVVIMCSSADGSGCGGTWDDGFIAFVDANRNGAYDAAGDQMIAERSIDATDDFQIRSVPAGLAIRFDSQGFAIGNSGDLVLCDDRGAERAKGISVAPTGMVTSISGGLSCD